MKATRSFYNKASLKKRRRPIADSPRCWSLTLAKDKVVRAAVAFDDAMNAYVKAIGSDLLSHPDRETTKRSAAATKAQENLAKAVKAYKAERRRR